MYSISTFILKECCLQVLQCCLQCCVYSLVYKHKLFATANLLCTYSQITNHLIVTQQQRKLIVKATYFVETLTEDSVRAVWYRSTSQNVSECLSHTHSLRTRPHAGLPFSQIMQNISLHIQIYNSAKLKTILFGQEAHLSSTETTCTTRHLLT